ncbi:hypothetical protein Tco_0012547 [Tanacetum coccineum]
MVWNNISNSLFVGGTYGIAGAGLGTSPELIGPGVQQVLNWVWGFYKGMWVVVRGYGVLLMVEDGCGEGSGWGARTNPAPHPYVPPTNKELEMLFQPMFDEYFNPPGIRQDPIPNIAQDPSYLQDHRSIAIDLDAPSGSHTSSPLDHHSSSVHQGVAGEQYAEVNPFATADSEPFVNVFAQTITPGKASQLV